MYNARTFPGKIPMFGLSWVLPAQKTIREDWCAFLRGEKLRAHEFALGEIERASAIYRLTLSEAISQWSAGNFDLALEQASLSADLCERYTSSLESVLQAVDRHAQYFGSLPATRPLNPDDFTGKTARRTAIMNALLSNVLFKRNNRFLHKLKALAEIISDIGLEYRIVVMDALDEPVNALPREWVTLSSFASDLDTSLQEAKIVLKSFLVSMPEAEVVSFRSRLVVSLAAASAHAERRAVVYRRD
jgi:hypothetical protein